MITNLFHTSYVFVYIVDQVNANLSLTKNQVKYVFVIVNIGLLVKVVIFQYVIQVFIFEYPNVINIYSH